MPSFTSLLIPVRRSLAGHLDRLRGTLDDMSEQLRAALGRAIGRTAADVVRQAVEAILTDPSATTAARPVRPAHFWEETDSRRSRLDEEDRLASHDLLDPDAHEERRFPDEDLDDCPAGLPGLPGQPHEAPLQRPLLAGCQAAAWWLRRHPGRLAWPAALGAGLLAALAACVRGSVLLAGSGVVLAALALLALADAARSGAQTLADSTAP